MFLGQKIGCPSHKQRWFLQMVCFKLGDT